MIGESWKSRAAGSMAMHTAMVLLGLGGMIVVLLCTWRYGAGTFTDAENHLSAARNLLAGKGLRYYYGGLYTHWPPLFPTLLAAIGLTGVDPQVGARWLNGLAFGLIVFFSGRLFLRCTTSRPLALAGTLAVLASSPLVAWCIMTASEPVFILLVLLFALCVPAFLRRQSLPALVLVSVLAALACLQRYAGASLIPAGVLLIGLGTSGAPFLQRIKHLVIFAVISTTPLALWCLRNRIVAGETVGVHRAHLMSGAELLGASRAAIQVVGTWLFPWEHPGSVPPVGLGLVLALAATAIVLSRRIGAAEQRPRDRAGRDVDALQIWSAAVVGLAYFGFIVACGAGLAWRPEQRHLAPIYPFVMALMVAGIGGACRVSAIPLGHRKMLSLVAILLSALWLRHPLNELLDSTASRMKDGAGGFSTSQWEESPLVEWLRSHPLEGEVYSNGSDAVYLLTGVVTSLTPQIRQAHGPPALARDAVPQTSHLVWFHRLNRLWLYDLREVLSCCRVEEVATFPDGAVYRYLGPCGPELSAVYRFWSAKRGRHFYTIRKNERDRIFNENDGTWSYEGPVFYAIAPDSARPADVLPVYRFWSAGLRAHFYTIDEAEKDQLLAHPSGAWTCEGVAFYAWREAGAKDTVPVHRFWSQRLGYHFFTISETEKAQLIDRFSDTWTYEGVAWYACGP